MLLAIPVALFGCAGLEIGAQQVSTLPQSAPDLTIFFDRPVETHALGCIPHRDVVEIVHLGMASLNPPQAPLHFVAVFQPTGLDSFRQALQGVFHASREAVPDGLLFFLPAAGAAQKERLLALRNGYLLHLHFRPHLRPVVL